MKAFTLYLKRLAAYSAHADAGMVTDDEYSEFQGLLYELADVRDAKKLASNEYTALCASYFVLKYELRDALGLDNRPTSPEIYTQKRWTKDGEFKAFPGQEVDARIYNAMQRCIEPKQLPEDLIKSVRARYGLQIEDGFVMGQPLKDVPAFYAFGKSNQMGETRFYYLGVCNG